MSSNQVVGGSNPSGRAMKHKAHLAWAFSFHRTGGMRTPDTGGSTTSSGTMWDSGSWRNRAPAMEGKGAILRPRQFLKDYRGHSST